MKKKTAETADSQNLAQNETTNEATQELTQEIPAVEFRPNEYGEVANLKQEIERLKSLLQPSTESMEERIKYYQRKQELITRMNKLDISLTQLESTFEELNKQISEDAFISDTFHLKISRKPQYSNETEIFKFYNPEIIHELVIYLSGKIQQKRDALQFQISAI